MRYLLTALLACATVVAAQDRPTTGSVLRASSDSDWRAPSPENMLYLELDSGRVVFELAPDFAPNHIANIRKLVANKYFDGLAIVRSQDNYVVQWGDPKSGNQTAMRSLGNAAAMLEGEFYRDAEGLSFNKIDSKDSYADEVGFVSGFPAGSDGEDTWLAHCFGMLGVGRANSPASGNGAELYVVTGHSPRHLDRNVTLVGRVIQGMELLTTLPRGTGPLGFYENEEEYVSIRSIRFGIELPANNRLKIELLRTDTETFANLVEARRYRAEEWFVEPAGRIGLCNVPIPSRVLD